MTHAQGPYTNQAWIPLAPPPLDANGLVPFEGRPRWEPEPEFDPSIYVAPPTAWGEEPALGAVEHSYVEPPDTDLGFGDHVGGATEAMMLPGLVTGGVSGVLAASRMPGNRTTGFLGAGLATAGGIILQGAAMGALVGATSPDAEDDLSARYAVAGGVVGAASGAMFPGRISRGASIAAGAVTTGVLGWFAGRGLDRRESHAHDAALALGTLGQ